MNTRPKILLQYSVKALKELALDHAEKNYLKKTYGDVSAYYTVEHDFEGVIVECTNEQAPIKNTQAPE